MSSPVKHGKGAFRFAVERELAPHVEESWAEGFVLELRLLGVAGARIGAALTEVESHCVDGGESALESFGDPVGYARSLDLPESEDQSPRAVVGEVRPFAVQLAGMFVVIWSFGPWLSGQRLEITVGQLVSMVLAALAVGAVARFAEPLLRAVVYHPVRLWFGLWLLGVVNVGVAVAALLLLDSTVWGFPAGWGLAMGWAVLAGGAVWAYKRLLARNGLTDRITAPFALSPLADAPVATSRLGRLLESPALSAVLTTAMIPVGTVVILVLRQTIGSP